ncbi:uncharacterized protein LOC122710281 isoform X7 [Cervus elaphus]|uniref:uncharacterized protein LOC122710281 isoform X7 n=1 Tax=Cervus elaphus TaxID=9860 RepID=UPI001CC331AF|nr:uncharacterized protein LOC122710281 isoform X7 [Cervus elaphus]
MDPGRRCGKPWAATLFPSPRTTGEPTTGRTDRDFVNDVSEKEQRWGACLGCLSDGFVRLPSLHSEISTNCGRMCFKNTRPSGRKRWKWDPKPRTATEGSLAWSRTGWTSQLSALSISQSCPSAACRLTPSGGLEASLVSSWPEWTRWLFTRTWEAPRDTQGRTLSAGRFTGHRGHRLGTSPTLGLRAGGDTPQRPPDRLLTPAADRTPWLTQPSHQGRSQN